MSRQSQRGRRQEMRYKVARLLVVLVTGVAGELDWSQAALDPATGLLCVQTGEGAGQRPGARERLLSCTHTRVEVCQASYPTRYRPTHGQQCEETFEKRCRTEVNQEAENVTVEHCYQANNTMMEWWSTDLCCAAASEGLQ